MAEIALGEIEAAEEGVIVTETEIAERGLASLLPLSGPAPEGGVGGTANKTTTKKTEKVENLTRPDMEVGTAMRIETSEDERDEIEPYKQSDVNKTRGNWPIRYMRPTRWILPSEHGTDPVFPDEAVIKEYIYESSGILSNVLQKMHWHTASKGELMRWIAKYGIERDLMMARDGLVDKAEGIVDTALDASDLETAKFVLKTAGKKRGWNERTEDNGENRNVYQFINVMTGSGKGELDKMTDRDLVKYLEDQISESV